MFLYLYRCPAIVIPSINGMVISSTETVDGIGVVDDAILLCLIMDVSIVDVADDVDTSLTVDVVVGEKEGEDVIILCPETQHNLRKC